MDSKSQIDNQLKKSCEIFIENVSEELLGNIRLLIKKVVLDKLLILILILFNII
jgi:hypothetical protein